MHLGCTGRNIFFFFTFCNHKWTEDTDEEDKGLSKQNSISSILTLPTLAPSPKLLSRSCVFSMRDACCSVLNHVQCSHGTQGFAAQILQMRGRTRGQNSIGFMLCSCSAQTWHIHLAFLSILQPPLLPTPLPQKSTSTGASAGHKISTQFWTPGNST